MIKSWGESVIDLIWGIYNMDFEISVSTKENGEQSVSLINKNGCKNMCRSNNGPITRNDRGDLLMMSKEV